MKRSTEELTANDQRASYFVKPNKKQLIEAPQEAVANNPMIQLLDGKEHLKYVNSRYDMYQTILKTIIAKVDRIVNESNTALFELLVKFIRQEFKGNGKMPVGHILLSSNTANNARILNQFYRYIEQKKDIRVARISSRRTGTSIKLLLKDVIRQLTTEDKGDDQDVPSYDEEKEKDNDKDGKDGKDDEDEDDDEDGDEEDEDVYKLTEDESRVTYDLELLSSWFSHNDRGISRIIIVIEDTEMIDTQVVNQFLKLIYKYNRLPIKLIFGLSSNNVSSWINDNINNEIRLLLENYKFKTISNKELSLKVLDEVFLNPDVELLLNEKLTTILLTRFYNSNNSIDNLVNEIRLCLMIHFYQSPFSVLLKESIPNEYVTLLRRLPSFKRHIEYCIFEKNHQELDIIEDDKKLIDRFELSRTNFNTYKHDIFSLMNELFAINSSVTKFEIYKLIIKNELIESKYFGDCLKITEDKEALMDKFHGCKLNVKLSDKLFNEIYCLHGGGNYEAPPPTLEENYENLMINLMRPGLRKLMHRNLTSSELYLDNELITVDNKMVVEPMIIKLYNLLKETPPTFNIYEFFMAFKQSLDKQSILKELSQFDPELQHYDDKKWTRLIYAWFIQICQEFLMLGFIKEKPRGDHFERNMWPGL